jgi:hypothetical protein
MYVYTNKLLHSKIQSTLWIGYSEGWMVSTVIGGTGKRVYDEFNYLVMWCVFSENKQMISVYMRHSWSKDTSLVIYELRSEKDNVEIVCF